MITKNEIITGIEHLAAMEQLWYNGRTPNRSWNTGTASIRKILKELLEFKTLYQPSNHCETCTCIDYVPCK